MGARIGLRLSDEDMDLLDALVRSANRKAESIGVPAEVTPSSVMRALIRRAAEDQGVTAEYEEEIPTRQVRKAPNVTAALRKLRESKPPPCR